MPENPCIRKNRGPGQFLSLIGMGLLLLAIHTGTAGAAEPAGLSAVNGTVAAPPAITTTGTEAAGGSVFFTTDPRGATISVDGEELGTSDFTYYFEEAGTLEVRAWKKGYREYTGKVTVSPGRRVVFEAVLMPAMADPVAESTTAPSVVATATTLRKSTLTLPTPWPSSPKSSPGIPAAVAATLALATGFLAARRR